MEAENVSETLQWYALSAPYRRERAAQELLEKHHIENFLPLTCKIVTNKSGRKVRKFVPVVSNLLFARTTRETLQEIKMGVPYLQFRTRPEGGKNVPITVPDYQMSQFMTVCRTQSEQLLFMQPHEIDIAKGSHVRIIGGALDGVEGVFVKVKGARSKRVVVMLEGVTAVAAEVEPQFIEVLNNTTT